MYSRLVAALGAVSLCAVLASAASAEPPLTNHRVSVDNTAGAYTRYDGGTDQVLTNCNNSLQPQLEPTIGADPRKPKNLTAGAIDLCIQVTTNPTVLQAWVSIYRSKDGGQTWTASLIPGYPGDNSPAGLASPAHGQSDAADPVTAYDNYGRVFYAFGPFIRASGTQPLGMVAIYDQGGDHYVKTVQVNTDSLDKEYLVVDNAKKSPFEGNIYLAGGRRSPTIPGFRELQFFRSTDHGDTWTNPITLDTVRGNPFVQMGTGPDGALYLVWRSRSIDATTPVPVYIAKSTDGGQTFSPKVQIASILPFDTAQMFPGTGGTCGDGPFACPAFGYMHNFAQITLEAVAADKQGVHVVWNERVPGGQAKVFVRNSPDGVNWPTPAFPVTGSMTGHEYFPDLKSDGDTLTVVYGVNRDDPAYSPTLPPGTTADGHNPGPVNDIFVSQSTDGGLTWVERRVTSVGSNLALESEALGMAGTPGDYWFVTTAKQKTYVSWGDKRDVVLGEDTRDAGQPSDPDGFDTLMPCDWQPNSWSGFPWLSVNRGDPCFKQGGADGNVYMARIPDIADSKKKARKTPTKTHITTPHAATWPRFPVASSTSTKCCATSPATPTSRPASARFRRSSR